MSKICLHCGCSADDIAKFCTRCGSRFPDDAVRSADEGVLTEENGAEAKNAENGDNERKAAETDAEQLTVEELTGRDFFEDGAEKNAQDAPRETEGNKIGAEWQGSDCRRFGAFSDGASGGSAPYTPYAGNPYGGAPQGLSAQEFEERRRQWMQEAKKTRALSARKTLFILAFVGLLLDFICGIGFFMSLPTAIVASVYAARLYKEEKKASTQLTWAMIVGYIGAILGIVFFILVL